jgi:hypothetical protein
MPEERPASDSPARPWRRHGAAEAPAVLPDGASSAARRRRRTLIILLAACSAVAGAILGWLFLLRGFTEPYFLTIPFTEYLEPALPVNAWAAQDSQALRAHFSHAHRQANFQEGHQLADALATLRTEKRPVVVHLRAHAVARDGQVLLLPGDARLGELEVKGIPLENVLQAIRQSPGDDRLLLLDVMRPLAEPSLGILADDTAAQVDALLERELAKPNAPPLWVLSASGPGQVSLVSEELGLSVFGHYLNEGLHGRADGQNPKQEEDGRVSVQELARFVEKHVSHWARQNRGADQRPVLRGGGRDFHLVSLSRRRPPPPEPPSFEPYPDWLLAGWELRDRWWRDGDYLSAPQAVLRLEAALLRAEQRWRGGVSIEDVKPQLGADQRRLTDYADAGRLPPVANPSLAWAHQNDEVPDSALLGELRKLLEHRRLSDKFAKPEEGAKLLAGLAKSKESLLAKCKDRPFQLAWAVLDATGDDASPDAIVFLAQLVSTNGVAAKFPEIRFLLRLADSLNAMQKKRKSSWADIPPALLRYAVQCTRVAERAAATDPRVLPWLREPFERAVAKRVEGLRTFLKESPERWPRAVESLQSASQDFAQLAGESHDLARAYSQLDEALATLPEVLPYLRTRRVDDPLLRSWNETIKGIQELERVLADRKREDLRRLRGITDDLERDYSALRSRLSRKTIGEFLARSEADEPMVLYNELDALLASPWLLGKVRAQVWEASRRLARDLNEATRKEEARGTLRAAPSGEAAGRQSEQAELRARLALDLLRTARAAEAAKLADAASKIPRGAPASAWSELGEQLRAAWTRHVSQEITDSAQNLDTADRTARLLPLRLGEIGAAAPNPTAQQLRRARTEYLRWLDKFRQEDAM